MSQGPDSGRSITIKTWLPLAFFTLFIANPANRKFRLNNLHRSHKEAGDSGEIAA